MDITLYSHALRYVGIPLERPGDKDHPLIQWWLSLCGYGLDAHDEIAWCSAFGNGMAWDLRLSRSKSAAARSWLTVGIPLSESEVRCGFDVVIYKRGSGVQPGPETIKAPGHMNIFGAFEGDMVVGVGGNQSDGVTVARYHKSLVLGYRRLVAA